MTMPRLDDYDGPLGAIEPELARRRIAAAKDGAGRICLVRPDSVVLQFDEATYGAVEAVIAGRGLDVLGGPPPHRPTTGVIAARPPVSQRPRQRNGRWETGPLLELMDSLRSDDYVVRPNHVYLTDGVHRHFHAVGDGGSSGTPGFANPTHVDSTVRPAPSPVGMPQRLQLRGRRPPHVLVLDTGLRTARGRVEHPALDNCRLHQPWLDRSTTRFNDEDEPDDDGRGRLDQQAGHGTFISGIIRQLCPDAIVHHRGVLTSYGDGDDASVTASVGRALADLGTQIDVVVMSFGTYADGDDAPAIAAAIARLPEATLVVAAAGNDAMSRPYFPAALGGVVGVGALDHDGRAAFSNFGPWVDACTPAVDVVSTFFVDFDDRRPSGAVVARYRGWARWSGTSFAAPKVAALVAQEMYVHGGTAHDAWARLAAATAFRVPQLGALFNV